MLDSNAISKKYKQKKSMNRQYCILVYSKQSVACKKLFEYVESLPFDLFSTTGMALCCVDNGDMRQTMERCGVTDVPTLLSKYFNHSQQQLVGTEIYDWIATLAARMGYREDSGSADASTEQVDIRQEEEQRVDEPVISQKSRGDVIALALSMQKSREAQMGLNKKQE